MYTIEDLLKAWISKSLSYISDRSGNFEASYADLHDETRKYCDALGIEWSDSLLPDYVWDTLERHPL